MYYNATSMHYNAISMIYIAVNSRPTKHGLNRLFVSIIINLFRITSQRDPQKVGEKIFLRIFHLNPETKNAFHAFKNLKNDELIKNSMFKSHAIRFMLAIEVGHSDCL